MAGWKRNINLLYVIRICFNLIFSVSVITLFWQERGLDLFLIFLLQAIFAVSIVIFEIPTGYIGDRLGRKKTITLAALIAVAGWIYYSQCSTFVMLVSAEVLLGIGFSFLSGTDTALLYESLIELKEEATFTKVEGRQVGFIHAAEAVSALGGGLLAAFLPLPWLFLFSSGAAAVALGCALGLKEPPRTPYRHPKGAWYGVYKIARFIFLRSKSVKYAVPLMAACSLSTMLGVWLYQPLWSERDVPVWLFGLLWAGFSLPAMLASQNAYRLEKFFGKAVVLWLIPLPAILGYLLIAWLPSWFALLPVYLVPVTRGLTVPLLSCYIHEETYSDKRATVMSVQSWLFRLFYFFLGPVVGLLAQKAGLRWAFIFSAGCTLLLVALYIPRLIRLLAGKTGTNPA
jgi:MFS family permease